LRGFDVDVDVVDGHDLAALRKALDTRGTRTRVVLMQTVKGHGVGFMEGRMEWHYLPLDTAKHALAQADVAASGTGQ
jgi:transketolase